LKTVRRSDGFDMVMKSLKGDNEFKKQILESFRGSVVRLAFDARGCRVAQCAFEVMDTEMATELLSEFRGQVGGAIRSPHANHVIQRVIEVLPPTTCGFIAEEMRVEWPSLVRHRYGCRVFCRLLENMKKIPACVELFKDVLEEAAELCRHHFGHYVMQSVMEHGQRQQRSCVVTALNLEWSSLAIHPNASRVIQKALWHGSAKEQQQICEEFFKMTTSGMVTLATNQYGSFVANALLQSGSAAAFIVAKQLCEATAQLQCNRNGRHVHDIAQQLLEEENFKPASAGVEQSVEGTVWRGTPYISELHNNQCAFAELHYVTSSSAQYSFELPAKRTN